MLDKVSLKLLKSLYTKDLPEEAVIQILGGANQNHSDPRITYLKEKQMISTRHTGGIPDGEGGFLDGTIKHTYHLELNGRAEVERVRKSHQKWLIGTGIALLAATGAILSGLSSWLH